MALVVVAGIFLGPWAAIGIFIASVWFDCPALRHSQTNQHREDDPCQ